MAQRVARVRADLLDTLVRKCRATQARAYIPSAGPACFLDPALQHFNDRKTTIFPLWNDIAENFSAVCPEPSVLPLDPGDRIALPSLAVTSQSAGQTSTDLEEYSRRRKAEWGEFYAEEEPAIRAEELKAYFGTLQRRNEHLAKDVQKYVRVVADGKSWGIHLGKMAEDFFIEGEDPYPPEYVLLTPPRVLQAVLQGKIGWEEALLSMRIRLRRDPDVFDSRFMGLLRYGNEPAQTLQMAREAGECEMIEKNGLQLQRFCPHAGEDLTNAIICGNVIECPRHHWKWDSTTGRCIEGGTLSLKITRSQDKEKKQPVDIQTTFPR